MAEAVVDRGGALPGGPLREAMNHEAKQYDPMTDSRGWEGMRVRGAAADDDPM